MAYMRLGDLLVASGTITWQQLERALALQKETKQRLGDVLIQNGFITEAQLIDALRVQLGVDFVDRPFPSPWSWPSMSPGTSPRNTAWCR